MLQIGRRPDHGFDEPLGLLSDCHRRIEHFLGVLIGLDQQVCGGPLTSAHRADLDAAQTYFAVAAPRHTADEEESLFPRLRECADPAAAQALEAVVKLERDHDEAGGHHAAVDTLVRRWVARDRLDPEDAHALREHLAALHAIYQQHIRVEDGEVFPAAARLMSVGQIAEMGREMAARRSPSVRDIPPRA